VDWFQSIRLDYHDSSLTAWTNSLAAFCPSPYSGLLVSVLADIVRSNYQGNRGVFEIGIDIFHIVNHIIGNARLGEQLSQFPDLVLGLSY
jgi:hypothetical protein